MAAIPLILAKSSDLRGIHMDLDLFETLLKQFKVFFSIILRNKQIHLTIVAQFDTCSAVSFSSAEMQVCVQYISVTKNNACEIVEKTLRSLYVL
jgi:hypothetical protein